MDFDRWTEIYDISPVGSEAKDNALDKMADLAKTFNEWINVFYRTPLESALEKMALFQMATHAKIFGQWLNIYQLSLPEDGLKDIALTQLIQLADEPKDADWTKDREALNIPRWIKIFEISPLGGEIETFAGTRIAELMLEKKCKDKKEYSQCVPKI